MQLLLRLALLVIVFGSACRQSAKEYTSWRVTGGSPENIRYSSLDQINTSNVNQLEVVWTYHTGDADTINQSQIQCNPIVVDGILYGTSPQLSLFALDAATGKERWSFNPKVEQFRNNPRARFILNNNRGVTYWEEEDDKRILFAAGGTLYAVNATDGSLIPSFGDSGKIDLRKGLDRIVDDLYVAATSPGIVYKNLYIIGSRVSEGSDAAPGHIRAFDVKTGERKWIFHTIPQPGQYGYDTWDDPKAYQHIGGANAWCGFSLDLQRGIVFASTGSASFDFYGGKRKGSNLFANCILALNAATGERVWHYQTVHHDTWDYDLPTPPALITIERNGKPVDAIAQPTKTGFVFLLERETGIPLFPIEEVAVSTETGLSGEQLWSTQPVPTLPKPFIRQKFTEADLNNLLPDSSYQELRQRFLKARSGEMFMPQSLQGNIQLPGLDGGAEWGGPAFDPATNLLYINANEMAWHVTMKEVDLTFSARETFSDAGKRLYQQNCMVCHATDLMGSGNNPSLQNASEKYDETSMEDIIISGRRMMPGFPQLKKEERLAISTYLLDLREHAKEIFPLLPGALDSFRHLPYGITGYYKFLSKEGYPGIKPPWGSLSAIDLVSGELVWRVPLGEHPSWKQKNTGTENYGGPVVTAGGVLFIAAASDRKLRAFNKQNGALLWEVELPASGFATPAVYEVNGKQVVVIACGGGKLGTRSGDAYVAFALPEKKN